VPHADPDTHPDVRVPQHATADPDADMYLHADADAD
jgi:hypothetical protein